MFVAGPGVVRWSARAVAALVVLAAVGAAGVSYVAADKLVHPPREHRAVTPAGRGLAYDEGAFTTDDGLTLAAWWIPAGSAEHRGTVVFLHGYGASRSQALAVAPFLHRAGYHVLAFDFRAHGDSEGTHTTIGIDEAKDVAAAVAYVRALTSASEPVALFGWSMGAAAALNAAEDVPDVRAIIVDSSFARLANIVSNDLDALTGLPEFPFAPMIMLFASKMAGHGPGDNEPARHAATLHRPILVIQGTEDRIASPEGDGRAIADSAGAWGQFWLVQGAGHVDARRTEPREYEAHVLAFLAEALG
ncbi:MAG TPA: alpha/beta fold hydrolase [Candidatus Thermoplasmatota archaeon]|nr:alpha/beta fold hydrolase [Candidatus Thermoplasmatota archaeon]